MYSYTALNNLHELEYLMVNVSHLSSVRSPPSRIIHGTLVYPLTLYRPFLGFYFFNGLMCVLQVLQIFWAALILRMVVKFLPGNVRSAAVLCPLSLGAPAWKRTLCKSLLFLFVAGHRRRRA